MSFFIHKQHLNKLSPSILLAGVFLVFTGCAAPQPLLSRNSYHDAQGEAEVQMDIEHCQAEAPLNLAEKLDLIQVTTDKFREMGQSTGETSAKLTSTASDMGAAYGDAIGTVIGLIGGMAEATKPDDTQKQAVRECLESRGYALEGWG